MTTNIHPSAVIHPSARLGRDLQIGPGAVIEAETVIGDHCILGPHAVVHSYTTLGAGCRLHAGAVIGDIPQDLIFQNMVSYTRIGERCVFREGVTIHRGTKEGTETRVGNDCYLMANSHLAHNVTLGNRVILANGALLGGYVDVGDNAFLSGNIVVHQFCRIGRLAMIGGLSGLSKDVPPFCTTRSCTANQVLGLNVVGLRRAGFTPEQRREIKRAFDVLYRSGLNVSQARERLIREFTSGPASEFAAFVSASKRGICGWSGASDQDGDE